MADYQKMYSTLFNAITDAIEILQEAQKATEELYISSDQPDIRVLNKPDTGSEDERDSDSKT